MKKSQIVKCGPCSWWGWFVFSRFIVNNNNKKNKRSLACIVFANRINETFWLIMDFSLRLSSSPLTNIWQLKKRRRQRQWERQKSNRFRLTKQQLCSCITLLIFVHFFLPSLHDYDVKMRIFTFCGRREHKERFSSSVPELRFRLSEFSSRKNLPTFDELKEMEQDAARLHFVGDLFVVAVVVV